MASAMTDVRWVTRSDELRDAVDDLSRAATLALDTEGNGMHAYRTSLCTIQLSVALPDAPAGHVYVVDPLVVTDLGPLGALLADPGREVIIHDLAFDARLLATVGVRLGRVVDTALHARFLGLKATGLSALLLERCAVTASKAHQHDDWARRPLDAEQMAYLAADVTHLGMLATSLARDARDRDIEAEIAAETAYALANAYRDDEGGGPAYVRIRGVRDLAGSDRVVARALAHLRETLGEQWNMPVGRVISNAAIIDVARKRPRSLSELRKLADLGERRTDVAPRVMAVLAACALETDVPEEEQAWFTRGAVDPGELRLRRERENALSKWRAKESAARGVDLQVVLPGHVLADLTRQAPTTLEALREIPGIGEARVVRYGGVLLDIVRERKLPPEPPTPT